MSVFDGLVRIITGRGDKVLFWKDHSLGGKSISDMAPLVLRQVSTQCCNSRTVQVALILHKWIEDVVGTLSADAAAECAHLWAYITEFDRLRSPRGR
jgi:hypothetical protein